MSWKKELVKFNVLINYNKEGKKEPKFPSDWTNFTKSQENLNLNSYAILTGEKSKITVLDFDISEKEGIISGLELLNSSFFLNIKTFKVKTPSGGFHLYFKYTDKIKITNDVCIFEEPKGKIAIDLRNNKRCVFGFGTEIKHNEEIKKYEIIDDIEPIEMPESLIEKINERYLNEFWEINEKKTNSTQCNKVQFPFLQSKKEEKIEKKDETYLISKSETSKEIQLKKKLKSLNFEKRDDYKNWTDIGMIIFNLTGNIDIWKDWSKKSWPEDIEKKKEEEKKLEYHWNSFKEDHDKKLGWNRLNEMIEEDWDYDREILQMINDLKIEYHDQQRYILKIKRNPYDKKKDKEEYNNYVREIQKDLAKHFVICQEGGKAFIFYYKYDILKGEKITSWEQDLALSFIKQLGLNLLQKEDIIHAKRTTLAPGKPKLYLEEGDIIYNRYIEPTWNLEKLEKWEKEEGNKETFLKVSDWLKYHFLEVICGGVEKDYIFLCNWIGNTLFNPLFFPRIAPILRSSETGRGKTAVVNKIFRNFLGDAYGLKNDSIFTGKGTLSTIILKTFSLIDEVKIEDEENYNKLKTLITEDSINYEAKFKDVITIPNHSKFILATNSVRAITCMVPNERRFCEFNLKSHLTHKEGYFNILDEKWQYFTLFFRDFQRNDIIFENHKTEVNSNNTKLTMNNYELFIKNYVLTIYSDFIENKGDKFVKFGEFYNSFSSFLFSEEKREQENKYKKISEDLFFTHMTDRNIFIGQKVRKQINGERCMWIQLQKKDLIVESFKKRNSNVNPFEMWEFCECGNKALFIKDNKKLCNKCLNKNEYDEIIPY